MSDLTYRSPPGMKDNGLNYTDPASNSLSLVCVPQSGDQQIAAKFYNAETQEHLYSAHNKPNESGIIRFLLGAGPEENKFVTRGSLNAPVVFAKGYDNTNNPLGITTGVNTFQIERDDKGTVKKCTLEGSDGSELPIRVDKNFLTPKPAPKIGMAPELTPTA